MTKLTYEEFEVIGHVFDALREALTSGEEWDADVNEFEIELVTPCDFAVHIGNVMSNVHYAKSGNLVAIAQECLEEIESKLE